MPGAHLVDGVTTDGVFTGPNSKKDAIITTLIEGFRSAIYLATPKKPLR